MICAKIIGFNVIIYYVPDRYGNLLNISVELAVKHVC